MDHDGRESMVSDLDVETLRLDGASTRRSSFSTLRSAMTTGSADRRAYGDALAQASSTQSSPGVSAAQSLQQEWRRQQAAAEALLQQSLHPAQQQAAQALLQGSPNLSSGASVRSAASSQSTQSTKKSMAEDYLAQGITYHEQGDMSRSAFYFERSANVDGGCVVGMCMWGMALREGWGARRDPKRGFEWIQRAATRAGEMSTQEFRSEKELANIRSELKLSVYELGKCYCYGWGTKTDSERGPRFLVRVIRN